MATKQRKLTSKQRSVMSALKSGTRRRGDLFKDQQSTLFTLIGRDLVRSEQHPVHGIVYVWTDAGRELMERGE